MQNSRLEIGQRSLVHRALLHHLTLQLFYLPLLLQISSDITSNLNNFCRSYQNKQRRRVDITGHFLRLNITPDVK